jgi:hypothetical protein
MKPREKKKRIAGRKDGKHDLNAPISQEDFANIIGQPQQTISKLCKYGVLGPGGTFREWFFQWDRFMKGRIFERQSWEGLAKVNGDR